MQPWQVEEADRESVKQWFDGWGGEVDAVDFETARARFHDAVIGFGTWMDMVEGRERLEAEQWRSIWPTIRDFHHCTEDSLKVTVSADRRLAVGLVIWTSSGFDEDGRTYDRPGRTTAVLVREDPQAPWQAIHTHVSLYRGVPQKSHGPQ